jgi:hypothetical protein
MRGRGRDALGGRAEGRSREGEGGGEIGGVEDLGRARAGGGRGLKDETAGGAKRVGFWSGAPQRTGAWVGLEVASMWRGVSGGRNGTGSRGDSIEHGMRSQGDPAGRGIGDRRPPNEMLGRSPPRRRPPQETALHHTPGRHDVAPEHPQIQTNSINLLALRMSP